MTQTGTANQHLTGCNANDECQCLGEDACGTCGSINCQVCNWCGEQACTDPTLCGGKGK